MLEFESRYVRPAYNLIVGIHVSRGPMRHRVFDLMRENFFSVSFTQEGESQGMDGMREMMHGVSNYTSTSRKFSGGP